MDKGYPVPEIAKYEKNFFNGTQPSTPEAQLYYAELQRQTDIIAGIIDEMRGTCNEEEILQEILLNTYDFVIDQGVKKGIKYDIFASYYVHDKAFDACYFMSLCQFLYESRRIKGKSLRKFIYDNSLRGYNVKGSPYYFNFAEKKRVFIESNSDNPENSSEQILKDEKTLIQYRRRLFWMRPGRRDSVEWSAMRNVSEHEWRSYFLLAKADKEVRDTEKRIRNLYNEINAAIKADTNDDYNNKLDIAREKFCTKLKKIQYERYLKLIKYSLEHIGKDKTCYGINLYRLEKELKPYRITTDVNRLVESVSETELMCCEPIYLNG